LLAGDAGDQGPAVFAAACRIAPLALGARFYAAVPAGPRQLDFLLAVRDAGWRLHQELVWVKNSIVLGHSDYHYRHEPILYGYTPGPGRPGRGAHPGTRWYGGNSAGSVLEYDRPARSFEHPTMKPVALVEHCLANSTKVGDAVGERVGDGCKGSVPTIWDCRPGDTGLAVAGRAEWRRFLQRRGARRISKTLLDGSRDRSCGKRGAAGK